MKVIIVFIVFSVGYSVFAQQTKKVLFLGNSYTAYNNLPQMVADLAASAGDNLSFDSNTPGGYTFNGHSTNTASLQKIQAGNWDFVVLQEQSQLPSFPLSQVQMDCFPFATILDSTIRHYNPCAETMFYMTWGRETGDAQNCVSWPPVCTYSGMDSLLRLRYEQMAIDNQAVLSPVGALWNYIRQYNPSVQLYASDGSHPSLAGSYAAACSFYSTIFRKDPTIITDDYGLSPTEALLIRNAAKAVVFDSLTTWYVGEYDPVASFPPVFQANDFTVQFINQSTNATSYFWDFDDGTTSNDLNPVHTYSNANFYSVQLVVENCGRTDTVVQMVELVAQSLEENGLRNLKITPNPAYDFVNIEIEHAAQISVKNMLGQTFDVPFFREGKEYKLDVSNLSDGQYFIQAEQDGHIYLGKIIKK